MSGGPIAVTGAACATAVDLVPPVFDAREPQLVANVAAAAAAADARLVYHLVPHPHTPGLPHHERKARAEAVVRAGAASWTVLQPAIHAQTVVRSWRRSPTCASLVPYALDAPFTPVRAALGETDSMTTSETTPWTSGHPIQRRCCAPRSS